MEDAATNKKAPRCRGAFASLSYSLTSFSWEQLSSLLELSSLLAFDSPPILFLFATTAHLDRMSSLLKVFLSHVLGNFKTKIMEVPENFSASARQSREFTRARMRQSVLLLPLMASVVFAGNFRIRPSVGFSQ